MKRYGMFGFGLIMVSAVACAPMVHDTSYYEYRTTTAPVAVYTSHTAIYPRAQTIEIMLYADRTYRGVYFQPMRLVISEGQYIEIPVRDRGGRQTRIFAHYHQQNLHFDHDRNCRVVHGSARYSYDRQWDTGHRYTNLNAGKDFDLTGLHLEIRNASTRQKPADARAVSAFSGQKQLKSHRDALPAAKTAGDAVARDRHNTPVAGAREQTRDRHEVRSPDRRSVPQQVLAGRSPATQNTPFREATEKSAKAAKPVAVAPAATVNALRPTISSTLKAERSRQPLQAAARENLASNKEQQNSRPLARASKPTGLAKAAQVDQVAAGKRQALPEPVRNQHEAVKKNLKLAAKGKASETGPQVSTEESAEISLARPAIPRTGRLFRNDR